VLDRWPPYHAREVALDELRLAMQREPSALDARFYCASFLRDHGRLAEAIALFEEILAIVPDHVETLVALAVVLTRAGRRLDARGALERALAHDAAHLGALVNLANLWALDDPQRAESLYHAALARDERFAPAHRGLCSLAATAGYTIAAAHHRSAGYREPFGRLPYYGERMPATVLALTSTDGGNIAPGSLLDPHIFLVNEVYVECYRGEPLPPHQLVVNLISDADRAAPALLAAARIAACSHAPVINQPNAVARTGRVENAIRLADLPGAVIPAARLVSRSAAPPETYPVIIRTPGRHMGRGMRLVSDDGAFAAAFDELPVAETLIVLPYVETRSPAGEWRKYRVMCIAGQLYPLHLAIAHRWDVHYFSAAMTERAEYRAEEAHFLRDPISVLGAPAWDALGKIRDRLGLDYMGIDFGLLDDGRIVLFEANAAMAVLAPDPDPRFAYRRPASDAIALALRDMLLDRIKAFSG
jgi:tetratricopeptide (TPR) repeat protein